jgi:hypothetical protein
MERDGARTIRGMVTKAAASSRTVRGTVTSKTHFKVLKFTKTKE